MTRTNPDDGTPASTAAVAIEPAPTEFHVSAPAPARGTLFLRMLRTTDHKLIGRMYMVTSFGFFVIGGILALLMRAELARPGMQFLSNEQYNQLFTMHGTIMLLLFATPLVFAFSNLVLPLQIGSPDVAFPRLNALSYWLYLFGALVTVSGFLAPGGAADFGWYAYSPLTSAANSPGAGADLWIMGLAVAGLGTILGAVNMVTTVITLRAPGMTLFRMPIFTWNILVTSMLVLLAFPLLTAALLVLWADRHWARRCSTPPTAAPSSGSTCSGSSATPRFTSSRSRSSASSPRSSRSSAASRCSATRA
jgi:cytochrome c oxidase subunit 1